MTISADPEKEYDECMLKAEALIDTIRSKTDAHENWIILFHTEMKALNIPSNAKTSRCGEWRN